MDTNAASSVLPPDLFDTTTLLSLALVVVLLGIALLVSNAVLPTSTSKAFRFLFVWHAFDALIHFVFEGSYLYHCFFSYLDVADLKVSQLSTFYTIPDNFLGFTNRVYGAQAGGDNPFAQLWMVYANADKRWAGSDLVGRVLGPDGVATRGEVMLTPRCCRPSSVSSSLPSLAPGLWRCTSATSSRSRITG